MGDSRRSDDKRIYSGFDEFDEHFFCLSAIGIFSNTKMSENKLNKPVFVVGHPRSGTTLLATILGRHSCLAMPPETQFLINNMFDEHARVNIAEIIKNPRIGDLKLNVEEVQLQFSKTDMDLKAAFSTLLNCYRILSNKQRVGEKSPMHLYHVEQIIKWFPDAKIVCIQRDCVDVIQSLMRVPWSHKKVARHAYYWNKSLSKGVEYGRIFSDNFMVVSYEKLTGYPLSEIQKICDFCELSFEPSMLDPEPFGTTAVPKWEESWKNRVNSTIEYRHPRSDIELLETDLMQIAWISNGILRESGYEQVTTSQSGKFRVLFKCLRYHAVVRPILEFIGSIFGKMSKNK